MPRHRYRTLSQVNVTSLVDVTLVLLIVFMLTAPLLQEGLEIELPQAEVRGIDMIDSWVITVAKDGSIYLNEKPVRMEDLRSLIDAQVVAAGGSEVFIRGDTAVPYGTIVRVIGMLKGAGVENVGLVAESEELSGASP